MVSCLCAIQRNNEDDMEIKVERDEDCRNYEVAGMPAWEQPENPEQDTKGTWFAGVLLNGEAASPDQMKEMIAEGALAADPNSLADDGTGNIYLPIELEEAIADGKWDVRKYGFPEDSENLENVLDGAGEMLIRYEWRSHAVEISIQFNM